MLVVVGLCMATQAKMSSELREAVRDGAWGRYVYRVVDDEGVPVSGATAHVWFRSYGRPQDKADWTIETDTNGMFIAEHRFNEKFSVGIDKEGYYHTHDEINYFKMEAPPIADGKWQPFGEMRTAVLKKIVNPIPIGELGRCSIPIPVYDEWVGFDFERRMWIPPFGNGRFSDVLLKFGRRIVDKQTDFKMTMEVSFTNNPYAGCYQLQYDKFSERKNVCHAEESAVYRSEVSYVHERHPGTPRNDNRVNSDSYLVFRTRTRVDEDGKLVSAHYGIIGGGWSFFGTMLSGGYLFNPTPNDTNLEDAETARKARLWHKQILEFKDDGKDSRM